MSENTDKLEQLEAQMKLLIKIRADRVRTAELQIKRANAEFDRDAIPVARKIRHLQEKIEDEQPLPPPPEKKPRRQRAMRHIDLGCEEDNEHFRELQARFG